MHAPRILIAASHSGTGKTTLTTGIILALRERGLTVQTFKIGPDYIDPSFHTLSSERPCRNLDTVMMGENGVLASFRRASKDCDISVIEGVMGMYDGFQAEKFETTPPRQAASSPFFGSTAHAAKVLAAPVILCIDVSSMAASGAAVALGFKELDASVPLSGFILNNVAGQRHFEMVRKPIEETTGLPVFGYLPKNKALRLPERHLGLVPAWEQTSLPESSKMLADTVHEHIDVETILDTARKAPEIEVQNNNFPPVFHEKKPAHDRESVPIGYALDEVFHFYYEDNLDILRGFGAELIPFSPVHDTKLPKGIKGIYMGGGYPELAARKLQDNTSMRHSIYDAAEDGMPIYAECGGLMYLSENLIDFGGDRYFMAGVFNCTVRMEKKLSALGYYRACTRRDTLLAPRGDTMWGHVFHWSTIEDVPDFQKYAWVLEKPSRDPILDGLIYNNVLAGYFHIHFAGNPAWARCFIKACSQTKECIT